MDIGAIIGESMTVFRKNYHLAVPTAISVLVVNFLSIAVVGSSEDPLRVVVMGFMNMVISLYAHGVTLAMAMEALRTGATSLKTGVAVAGHFLAPFILSSIIVGSVVILGTVLFIVPGVLAALFLMFVLPAIIVENDGPVEALVRSYRVVRKSIKESFMLFTILFMGGLVVAAAGMFLSSIRVFGQLAALALSGAFAGVFALVMMRAYNELSPRARPEEDTPGGYGG